MSERTKAIEDLALKLFCALKDAIIKERRALPEAIIEYTHTRVIDWVEVTTAWPRRGTPEQKALAKGLNSKKMRYESLDLDLPSSSYTQEVKGPIIQSILKKDAKASYDDLIKKYGKGILIIIPESIYLDPRDLKSNAHITNLLPGISLMRFKSVWLCLNTSHTNTIGNVESHSAQLIQIDLD